MSWEDVKGILWMIVFVLSLGVLFKSCEIMDKGIKPVIKELWNGKTPEKNKQKGEI
jgi:hypothetical protein